MIVHTTISSITTHKNLKHPAYQHVVIHDLKSNRKNAAYKPKRSSYVYFAY